MKIGIYAGSFNPIHNAHVDIARKIINEGYVDKVIFVPVGDGYEKRELVAGEKRYEMIKLAINDEDMDVSDIEIVNHKLYTYETLDYFRSKYKDDELYFILGSDNLSEFHMWKRYEYILNNYGLIVLLRNGDEVEDFKEYTDKNIIFVNYDFSLSSTEVRKNIKEKEYEEASDKLNYKVFEYIKGLGLYE